MSVDIAHSLSEAGSERTPPFPLRFRRPEPEWASVSEGVSIETLAIHIGSTPRPDANNMLYESRGRRGDLPPIARRHQAVHVIPKLGIKARRIDGLWLVLRDLQAVNSAINECTTGVNLALRLAVQAAVQFSNEIVFRAERPSDYVTDFCNPCIGPNQLVDSRVMRASTASCFKRATASSGFIRQR